MIKTKVGFLEGRLFKKATFVLIM